MDNDLRAVILAAGKSSRLFPLTENKPKCLLEVNGKKIIDWQINAIKQVGINNILVVTGHCAEKIVEEIDHEVEFSRYNNFGETNNLHTLWSVSEKLKKPFICFFSDILFDPGILKEVLESRDDFCLAVDTSKILDDIIKVKIKENAITAIGKHIESKDAAGNFIGIAKFSGQGTRILVKQMSEMMPGYQQDYYTKAIDIIARRGVQVNYVKTDKRLWTEVDTKEDLDKANTIYLNS